MSREEFSELEEAFVTLQDVKTVLKKGKKVGLRCLRGWTQHFDSADVTNEENVVSLEGVAKSSGYMQVVRNAIGDPSEFQECRQIKQLEPDELNSTQVLRVHKW